MKPLIKICGITNEEDALYAAGLNVWALGFVFAKSPRSISEDKAKKLIGKLPPYIGRVGVFVNETIEKIKETVEYCKLDMVQLHGDEDPQMCKNTRTFTKVIKAFRIKDDTSIKKIPGYDVDLYLLDTYSDELYGGTGKTFNWNLAAKVKKYGKDIILAGGLNSENIVEAIKIVEPYAVDISSGVEKALGKKDKVLLKNVVSKINKL